VTEAVWLASSDGSAVRKLSVPPSASTDREAMSAVPCYTSTPPRFMGSTNRLAFAPLQ